MRKALPLLFILAFVAAHAQTPTPIPVTGNVSTITNGAVPYAGVSIQLVNCPAPVTIPGTAVIAPTGAQLQADGTGLVNSTIWPNDKIDCNGTTGNSQYTLQYIVNGTPTADPVCYQILSTQGQWNLNTQQPVSCTQTPPNPQDATFNNVVINNLLTVNSINLTGAFTLTGAIHPNGGINASFTNTTSTSPPMTWTNPFSNISLADTTTTVQTSTAQGDPYVTPVVRVVSSDSGINDTAPEYLYHNCNWTTGLTQAPCVGSFIVAQNNSGDWHNGLWALNPIAIQYHGSNNSLTYGVEANVFNETGLDAGSPSNPNPNMSYIFGYAATMGGSSGSNGTAGFLVSDTNTNAYWWDGFWVERAKYAAFEAGPVGGNSGLQWSLVANPNGPAAPSQNFASVPNADIESFWNGTGSVLKVLKRQYVPNTGTNPVGCYDYTFSTLLAYEMCDNGGMVIHAQSGAQGLRVTPVSDGESDIAVGVSNAANSTWNWYVLKNGQVVTTQTLEADGGIKIGSNVVLPNTLTGAHGNSTKVQISDGSGATGHTAKYDANGNLTDGGYNQFVIGATLCTPATSTDAACTGTITLSPGYSDSSYAAVVTPFSSGGAYMDFTVTSKSSTSIGYSLSCTFNCGTYGTLTADVFTHHN